MLDNISLQTEAELAEFIAQFHDDPYGFVMAAYPWGVPELPDGSKNPLAKRTGPEPWQRDFLIALGEHIKNGVLLESMGLDMPVWKSAVASGHGVGKSTLVAWLIQFFMSTRPDTRGTTTANTQNQLEDRTWPELAKWHNLLINRHWFEWTATAFAFKPYPANRKKNYRITAATVSKDNTEAFAGLHNEGKTIVVLFDEASGIEAPIWQVAIGALTDGEAFFFAFGNPTIPDGEFADCFEKNREYYYTQTVDSRSVSHTNKTYLQSVINQYGIESDTVKVRILGQFPLQAMDGFIPLWAATEGVERASWGDKDAALIMAVDASRSPTGDKFVIRYRQGRDARSIPVKVFNGMKTRESVDIVAREANKYKPDAIVIEGSGPSTGLIDLLKELGYPVHEVYPGALSKDPAFFNLRMQWWFEFREWLYEVGCIDDDPLLFEQLTKIKYGYSRASQKMVMESKEDMAARGLPSPDEADSLVLTFAVNIARRDRNRHHAARRNNVSSITYDDPLEGLM